MVAKRKGGRGPGAARKRAQPVTSQTPPEQPLVIEGVGATPPPEGQRVSARRPMQYGGREYDMGEVFALTGLRNDERLLRLGYVDKVPLRSRTWQCRETGREYITETAREQAGRRRERLARLNEKQRDRALDREAELLQETAPLYLDRSAASVA